MARVFPALLLASLASAVSVTIPLTAPPSAVSVSQSLIGFSLEQDRWTDWAGTTASSNSFFFNALENLNDLTGLPPRIRIGADSEDHTTFNPALTSGSQTQFPPPTTTVPYPEATKIVVGDGYYQLVQSLPANTIVTVGLNLGQNNLTTVSLQAKSIKKAFASTSVTSRNIVLDAVEIGNEADLYRNNGLRASNYSIQNYVSDWKTFAANVTATVGSTKFWGCAFAGSSHSSTGFSPQSAFNSGLLTSIPPGSAITTISQHHYSGSFCSGNAGLLQDLMTKSTIRANLTIFKPDAAAVRAKGLDYVLGETNSYSCHGAPGVSNTAGAALWTLDYALFASQVGVSRVFFHEGVGYKYNLIQPVELTRSTLDGSPIAPLAPHVQPQYYAAIVAAEAIGRSGNTEIVDINVSDVQIAVYGIYEGTKLARALIINSLSFPSSSTNRTSEHIDFSISGSGTLPTSMTIKRLAINHSDDTSGLLWGGQSYENSGNALVSGTLSTSTAAVSAGLDIKATEVVLVTFS
ncbi:glycoside hydrolase family 79 protein [Mycena floridula]|nr:glycoside hydrolase family 79 protein [Mycena floridula]